MKRIGIAKSLFNSDLTEKLQAGALKVLAEQGVALSSVTIVDVPGALELPFAAQLLIDQGCFGVIVLGVVMRGETSHYDLVCEGAQQGCMKVGLDSKRPVIFGVVTTENRAQAEDRIGGERGNKGEDAAKALLKMMDVFNL